MYFSVTISPAPRILQFSGVTKSPASRILQRQELSNSPRVTHLQRHEFSNSPESRNLQRHTFCSVKNSRILPRHAFTASRILQFSGVRKSPESRNLQCHALFQRHEFSAMKSSSAQLVVNGGYPVFQRVSHSGTRFQSWVGISFSSFTRRGNLRKRKTERNWGVFFSHLVRDIVTLTKP